MRYKFQPLQELYWGVLTAALLVLLPALVTLEPEKITDWRVWAVALGGSTLRAAAGAGLDYVRRAITQEEPEPAVPPTLASIDPALLTEVLADYQRRKEQRERLRAGAEAEAQQQRPILVSFGSGQIEGKG